MTSIYESGAVAQTAQKVSAAPRQATKTNLVELRSVSIAFGGVVALSDVSFDIPHNTISGLIGPNGAGKTTLFNCLSRLYTPQKGDIRFEGTSILDVPAHRLAAKGICRSFQNVALFRGMSVLDNVRIGAHTHARSNFFNDMFRLPASRKSEDAINDIAWQMLDRMDLRQFAHRAAGELSFGIQKRVELARALASRPKLLLLDEPAGGLNHRDVAELGSLIRRIRDEWKVSVLLVEHHMGLVMSTADHIVVMNFGRKIAEGTPSHIQHNEAVIDAYLGTRKEVKQ